GGEAVGFSPPKHQSIQCRLKLRHSRESGNLESLKLQLTFEYCCYPTFWIPACAGMTVGRMRRHHDFSLFP
ncbi:hypothetical protein, partial [Neisseria lactamica]|uniref:hypothetical protein n=1 Tax=Neisseria lactamica TaxID=486 RepID=UPI001959FD85